MRKQIHKKQRWAASLAVLSGAVGLAGASMHANAQNIANIGFPKAEQWTGITGAGASDRDAGVAESLTRPANVVRYVNGFSFGETSNFGDTWGDNHLVKISAVLTAPKTGNFRFFIRADDAAALYVNTAGAALPDLSSATPVAVESGCCGSFEDVGTDGTVPEVTSEPIALVEGQQYGISFVVKEGGGGDWGQMAMREDGDPTPAASLPPLRGGLIASAHSITGATVALSTQPAAQSVIANQPVTFTAAANGSSPNGANYGNVIVYQWYKDGKLIAGANSATYTIPVVTAAMNGAKFRVAAAVAGASVLSEEAALTVTTDTIIPTVTKANGALTLDKVTLTFSEPVTAPSATTVGNYTLTGLTVTAATLVNPTTVELTTSKQTLGASYALTVNGVKDNAGLSSAYTGTFKTIINGVGFMLAEQWTGINGGGSADRDNAAIEAGTRPADVVRWVNGFSFGETSNFGDTWGENHLVKISGVFTPADGGNYRFFVRSDDASALFVNTEGAAIPDPTAAAPVAVESGCCGAFEDVGADGTLPEVTSDLVALQAGKSYGLAFLVKEGGGGDWGQVAVRKEGDTTPAASLTPLRGGVLSSPVDPSGASVELTSVPTDASTPANSTITFTAAATGSSPLGAAYGNVIVYQWYKNGKAILGANGATYTIPVVALADNGAKFAVGAGVAGAAVLSPEFTLTVTTDNTPPTVSRVSGSETFDNITVAFSEPVTDTALSAARYTVTGLTVSNPVRLNDRTIRLTTSKQEENKDYSVTVNGVQDLATNPSAYTGSFRTFKFVSGMVTYKTWQNESGGFASWTADPPVSAKPPTTVGFKDLYQANTADEFDNYFGQLSGYFIPATTGNYVFFVSSDDQGALYLSTDANPANKVKIADEPAWSGRNNWVGEGANGASRGAEGSKANRSDEYAETAWPSGNVISLTQGQRYYLEVLFKEGGGGDNGGATFKLADQADPAAGDLSKLTGNLIGTYIDPFTSAPLITKRPVGAKVAPGASVTLSVEVDSAAPVTYQWFRNKKAIAGATSSTYTIPAVGVGNIGDYYVDVTNPNGSASSFPDNDARVEMTGVALVVEAEDFNFGNGQTVAAASVMPLASDLYKGKDGIPGVDLFVIENGDGQITDDACCGNSLRQGWVDTAPDPDVTMASPDGGNADVVADGGPQRPDFVLTQNYKIGWGDNGEWFNYTRDFAPGTYSAVLGFSWDGRAAQANPFALDLVTSDPTKPEQTLQRLGAVTVSQTGGWSSVDNVPFMNADGTAVAEFTLGAKSTIRLTIPGGDIDYLLFYKKAGGDPTITPIVPSLPGAALTDVVVNTATKTITAKAPAGSNTGFLKVDGVGRIVSVTLVGDVLTVVYE